MTHTHSLQRIPPEASFYLLHHASFPARIAQAGDYNFEHEQLLLDKIIELLLLYPMGVSAV
jgi:hypothetical protein